MGADATQELRTVHTWDTTSVEEGAAKIDRAHGRAQSALDNTAKAVDRYNRATAKPKSVGSGSSGGHGGHGGHGGEGFAENLQWGLHDIAEGRTTNGLFRMASALKMVGFASIAAFQGMKLFNGAREANSQVVDSTLSLEKIMGEGRQSAAKRNMLYYPLERMFGKQFVDQGEPAQAARESIGGMAQQREEITAAIEKEQQARSGMSGFLATNWDMYASGLTGHSRMADSLAAEQRGNDKLASLDAGAASIVKNQTAAVRLGAFGSTREGALAQSKVEYDAKIAELDDAVHTGKMSVLERKARGDQAGSDQEIRDRNTNLQHDAAERERNLSGWNVGARGRGEHVAEVIAQNRMDAASLEIRAAPNKEAKEAAQTKYDEAWQDHRDATFARRERETDLETEKRIAEFRGSADDRSLFAASQQLRSARELLSIAKERGADAEKEAQVGVAAAERQLDLVRRRDASERLALHTSLDEAPGAVTAAGARLTGAAPEQAERAQLLERQALAEDAVRDAQTRVDLERGSVAALQGQVAAAKELAQAKISIALHDQDIRRERRFEMQSAQAQTAELRMTLLGRGDIAGVDSQRAQSRIEIEHANLEGKTDLAQELADQQETREQQAYVNRYLDEDGNRRNPSEINRADRKAAMRQGRIDTFLHGTRDHDPAGGLHTEGLESGNGGETAASRLLAGSKSVADRLSEARGSGLHGTMLDHRESEKNRRHGLTDVHWGMDGQTMLSAVDPLTHRRLNAREISERNNRAQASIDTPTEKASDNKLLGEILLALKNGLPKETH